MNRVNSDSGPGGLPDPAFAQAIAAHDAAVDACGRSIWVGAEPTFTLAGSEDREWLSEPLGGDKHRYALRLAAALHQRHPGGVLLRTIGRQYADEERPRWSIGLYGRRDGRSLWDGPADPLAGAAQPTSATQLDTLWLMLEHTFAAVGWSCLRFHLPQAFGRRLLLRPDGAPVELDLADPRLKRPSVHADKTPPEGLADPLADDGLMLVSVGGFEIDGDLAVACVELPRLARVGDFFDCLLAVSGASRIAGIQHLVFQGFPPPVDRQVAWTTVTPDPAVIEVNQAPHPTIGGFLGASRELFELAAGLGLSPYRCQYNGTVSDSGGGGQFTLGGPAPTSSPFFEQRSLLPRLVCYLNRHPALSYLFAPDYVGSASQSPRADEGTRDAFRELTIALTQLEREPEPAPAFLWASLAPFLADPSGNSHRSELNIEKLWNPHLPGRGCLGLVEFRAFRMPWSAERAAAVAALLRALAAMLCAGAPDGSSDRTLCDWGDQLHDRFALPFFLGEDLRAVFADLDQSGFGLADPIQRLLLTDPYKAHWEVQFGGCRLSIDPAIEFWPLVGDVASQESGGSRTVDSSTARLQLCLRGSAPDGPALDGWRLSAAGVDLPLRAEQGADGPLRLIGIRYRDFPPWRGLHPGIEPLGPLRLTLQHPALDDALTLTLHNWHPQGQAYAGLPDSPSAAAERRAERLVSEPVARASLPAATAPPPAAVSPYAVDLRLAAIVG